MTNYVINQILSKIFNIFFFDNSYIYSHEIEKLIFKIKQTKMLVKEGKQTTFNMMEVDLLLEKQKQYIFEHNKCFFFV